MTSRQLDPVFALLIGVSAAALRIKREEGDRTTLVRSTDAKLSGSAGLEGRDQKREVGWKDLWETGVRRGRMEWDKVRESMRR
jgi:hypothetical protein